MCKIWRCSWVWVKHRQVTDLDVTDLGFLCPGSHSARQVLCGDASRLFLDHFSKHLSSVSGRTELCHEARNPGPQEHQIIRNENHHLVLWLGLGLGFGVDLGLGSGLGFGVGIPENLFGLFLTFRVISILQGYFWRPSEKTL